MEELLKAILSEFEEEMKAFKEGVVREAQFSNMQSKIKVAIGMRRVGKSHFLLQEINSLLKEGISITQILYINFEDDRLLPVSQEKLRNLVDHFYSLYPENHEKLCYLFFDEIQNTEGWPVFIRRIFDKKKVQIYLTGSSAKLLSTEIDTSLRGRSMSTEIWPFSFREYLTANKKEFYFSKRLLGQADLDNLKQLFSKYLNDGGFPETLGLDATERVELLQNYVDVVTFKDIVERHNITNLSLIQYMIKSLIKNVGSSFSVNKFFNDTKSQGLAVSKNTLHTYLSYIEDVYLAFSVPLYDESLRKVHSNPRKIYAIDTGLVNAYNLSFERNLGHLFENLIYLDLKRMKHDVYYYLTKERYEVDFLSIDKLGNRQLIQVVWNTEDKETLARETRALTAAESELGIKGKIITPLEYIQNYHSR